MEAIQIYGSRISRLEIIEQLILNLKSNILFLHDNEGLKSCYVFKVSGPLKTCTISNEHVTSLYCMLLQYIANFFKASKPLITPTYRLMDLIVYPFNSFAIPKAVSEFAISIICHFPVRLPTTRKPTLCFIPPVTGFVFFRDLAHKFQPGLHPLPNIWVFNYKRACPSVISRLYPGPVMPTSPAGCFSSLQEPPASEIVP